MNNRYRLTTDESVFSASWSSIGPPSASSHPRDLQAQRVRRTWRTMGRATISVALTLLAILFGYPGGHAQDNGPTDTDLRAGYCLGLLQSLIPLACQIPTGLPPASSDILKQGCQKQRNNYKRLSAYLEARGYLFGPKDPTVVLVAENRGITDSKNCEAERTPEEDACLMQCPTTDTNSFTACVDACPAPESCARQKQCRDLSFLPF
jgi:hypothetical protein